MISFKPDFPLSKDDTNRILPWIMAFMVYLACLTIVTALNLNHYITHKSGDFAQSFTVQVPGDLESKAQSAEQIMEFLRSQSYIAEVNTIGEETMKTLVEPWLGSGDIINSLPLPIIMEAKVKTGFTVNMEDIRQRIQDISASTEVDDNKAWMERLNRLTRSVQTVAMVVVLMIGGVTFVTIVLAARTGLKLHRDSLDVLHLIGATDDYIAQQFQANSLLVALKGAAIGIGLAIPTLIPLNIMAKKLDWMELPIFSLSWVHAFAFLLMVIAVGGIAYICARLTVMKALNKA